MSITTREDFYRKEDYTDIVVNDYGSWTLDIGANVIERGVVRFRVWAPALTDLSVRITGHEPERTVHLDGDERGYFSALVNDVFPSDRYMFRLGHILRPDPASRFQPEGVHGNSEIVYPDAFAWSDSGWKGIPLSDFIIYELHVGTFTPEGTFEAITKYIDYLKDLGITVIELMPICQFVGARNWGYDGVYPFAPHNTYGGPDNLKYLVNECHRRGMAIILDVVYNHLGPEGNYMNEYSPYYFTERYRTPWGDAINFDGSFSDNVRKYFISNAIYWIKEYHFDGLRLDAIQGIFDFGAYHFLHELADAIHALQNALSRSISIIAESDLNDVRVINEPNIGGYGIDAQWNDDFHHALHALTSGDRRAYYKDFGGLSQMSKALSDGFVYTGQYSEDRKRRHGNSSAERPARQFVVFSQNHDQTCNDVERPDYKTSLQEIKFKACMVVLSPYVPLLFMGEEYAETSPFRYFVNHESADLIEAVRISRSREFMELWEKTPEDPETEDSFFESRIGVMSQHTPEQEQILRFYKELIRIRKQLPVLSRPVKQNIEISQYQLENTLLIRRWLGHESVMCLCNFGRESVTINAIAQGEWTKLIDSSSSQWYGKGATAPDVILCERTPCAITLDALTFVLYSKSDEK
ncbi:MAG TPA: malto-oligosyltrehalose trehalohydrolase [Syntrophorhabdaceae bacterium]|nr:malto-oligosyltrehalose trehalohydrolase [Syntrophorhabdaceae bacterium]